MKIAEQKRTSSSVANEAWRMSKTILTAGELNGALTLIAPGAEFPPSESAVERVLYVPQGVVTAAVGVINYIVNTDESLAVPAGKSLSLQNHGDVPAKVFILSLPAPRRADTPLVTLS